MEIPIKCKGNRSIPLNQLQNFQGNLKELKETEYIKLKNSILKYGFSFPVIVWNKKLIDGHQRIFCLKQMVKEEGYTIADIPAAEIEAKDEKEARYKLLLFNSQYGKVNDEGLYEFIEKSAQDFNVLKEELKLPNIDLDIFEAGYYENNIPMLDEGDFGNSLGGMMSPAGKTLLVIGGYKKFVDSQALSDFSLKLLDMEKSESDQIIDNLIMDIEKLL